MNSDKELLELAAKASGIELKWDDDDSWCYIPEGNPDKRRRAGDEYAGVIWNPLTDDGDALRLATKLSSLGNGFHIDIYKHLVKARFDPTNSSEPSIEGWCRTKHAAEGAKDVHEIDAAVRLAIVRCAAQVGKAMP